MKQYCVECFHDVGWHVVRLRVVGFDMVGFDVKVGVILGFEVGTCVVVVTVAG